MSLRPATGYLDLNLPEQQAEAAKSLHWDWSEAARQALTKYYRDFREQLTPEEYEAGLTEIFGHAPPVLLAAQRELVGITMDYGRNHTLDFSIDADKEFFEEFGFFSLTVESNGVPAQWIDAQGHVHDGDARFTHVKTFIEWYVAMKNFSIRVGMRQTTLRRATLLNTSFTDVLNDASEFAASGALAVVTHASDDRNVMWVDESTELTIRQHVNGRVILFLYTANPEVADQFIEWLKRYGTHVHLINFRSVTKNFAHAF